MGKFVDESHERAVAVGGFLGCVARAEHCRVCPGSVPE
jgi:hypothetical protein